MTDQHRDLVNTCVRMVRYPRGGVSVQDFEIAQASVDALADGEVLVRNEWLSLDPYMRLRMTDRRSYVDPISPGDTMPGGTVGTVVASRSNDLPVGKKVVGVRMKWEAYTRTRPTELRLIAQTGVPPSTALGVVGMPGVTAHYGLYELGNPRSGETVVVSAATGAVGSVVGQLAKSKSCRVVGIAGGAAKCDYAEEVLGFDRCVDYKADDFVEQLAKATPDRVDIQFENVGGRVMDAVFNRLNSYARVVVCGMVSEYNESHRWPLENSIQLLLNRASLQTFIVSEHQDYWPGALNELAEMVQNRTLTYREHVTEGLENAPNAFIDMLKGENFGKTLVKIQETTDH